ncbi:MAG: hypothetical protein ACI9EW_003622 [Cellvibrionaceae bacterium]|jgi:hypothetical protein
MDFQLVFICLCGACLIIPILGANVWYVVNIFRGRRAHIRLAEAGGYDLLHDASNDVQKIFGGEINGQPFAFRPAADLSKSYGHNGRSGSTVRMLMQIIFPLNNQKLAGFSMLKNSKVRGVPDTFAEIWSTKPSADVLSADAQQAIYEFAATNAHPAGIDGTTFRFKKIVRKLSIFERARWEHSLPADVFPDAVSQMIYDHPAANIDLSKFNQLLTELAVVAAHLEVKQK